ncbi:hypothetical protein [Kribbella sp. NPDC051770]|uniref:hypothetical protein n=1 Tax=Kribbella sp. NPDC051770 TaxID=3155413 RepID=UPI0034481506
MLIARSLQEAGLYVELHPCECGAAGELTFGVVERDGETLAVYEGDCPGCGRARRFEFRLPAEPVAGPAYGGEEPSRIVDAGEFLWYSDRATEQAFRLSAETDDDAVARGRSALEVAAAALDEVRKFVPAGATAVPREAIGSELGQALYDADPDRFTLDTLAGRRRLLDDALART